MKNKEENKKRNFSTKAAAVGLLTVLMSSGLAACSNEPEVTAGDPAYCSDNDPSRIKATFGETVESTKDAWSEHIVKYDEDLIVYEGMKERHYVPTVLTNVSDLPCILRITLEGSVEGNDNKSVEEVMFLPLKPNESAKFDGFPLEYLEGFSAADAGKAFSGSVKDVRTQAYVPNYYGPADFKVVNVIKDGEYGSSIVTVELSATEKAAASPGAKRNSASNSIPDKDTVALQGFNKEGEIVVSFYRKIEAIKPGETATIEFNSGGGTIHPTYRSVTEYANLDEVERWEMGLSQPEHLDIKLPTRK